jgi:hypothetical protein
MTDTAPKVFISYSWTSEDHQRWVMALATQLREAGVDVIFDKWDLKEGHDAYHFMEQMVSDKDVRKVAIVCDRKYAEKANERIGGVGSETQIISPEIYSKQDQDKFVVIVTERNEDGTPSIPHYYKSRIYIDLSDDQLYAKNFEQLLRWIFDKPLYIKPPLGKIPGFLAEVDQPSLGTTVFHLRTLDAIRNNRQYRVGALGEYFDRLSESFENLRLPAGSDEFDEQVIRSIDQFLPYRNEVIEIFLALAHYGPAPDEMRATHRFLERLIPYMHRPQTVTSFRDWDFDNYRFMVQELLLYIVACYLKYERFDVVGSLLRERFYIDDPSITNQSTVSFAAMWEPMKSLAYRNQRLNLRRLSLRAEILRSRSSATGVDFQQLAQADFTLFIRDCFDALRGQKNQQWVPETLLFARRGKPFEIYARSESTSFFQSTMQLFDIKDKADFGPLLKAFADQQLRIPRWEFESFSPAFLLGYERLATTP